MLRNRTLLFSLYRSSLLFVMILIFSCSGGPLKSREELLKYKNPVASLVFSEEGEVIGKFLFEDRINVSWDQIPEHLRNALIATEDARFFEHRGNDLRSFFRVLVKRIIFMDRSAGGGSTITQQLAKNMFGRREKGFLHVLTNKIREIIMARRLEKVFTKEEILTLYLNTVSFGENIYGIEAASNRFFNKGTALLRPEESAVLVGMLKANTYYNPRRHPDNARQRRNLVLRQMEKYNYLTSAEADSLSQLPMVISYTKTAASGPADYFLVQVRQEAEAVLDSLGRTTGRYLDLERDGLRISTTLNLSLQRYALKAFHDHLSKMQEKLDEQYASFSGKRTLDQITENELQRLNLTAYSDEVKSQVIFDWKGSHTDSVSVRDSLRKALTLLHAGLLAMDPVTGKIKAWVGGIDFRTQPFDQILARRQLASVFKPVLYAEALEEGMEPCQYLDNDSVKLSGFQDWSPENYDHSFGGKYSLSGALAHSMNIPTFSLFLEIGFERLDSMWKKLGFSFPLVNTPSLAMGTAEASIREVSVAYSAFANGGFRIKPGSIISITAADGTEIYKNDFTNDTTRILTERSGLLMSAMLQKAIREGTGAAMSSTYGVDFPLAGKTGTSQDYSDAWFAAFNPAVVVVARAGASTRAVHFSNGSNGSGSALALPLVALTLRQLKQNSSLKDQLIVPFPDLPPELENALDCPDFKDKSLFDRIIDIFEKGKTPYEKEGKPAERKIRNILRKIFRR